LPVRQWDGIKCGSSGKNLLGIEFEECVYGADRDKDTDYENLKTAFLSCK
jgi:hypothetical protein